MQHINERCCDTHQIHVGMHFFKFICTIGLDHSFDDVRGERERKWLKRISQKKYLYMSDDDGLWSS